MSVADFQHVVLSQQDQLSMLKNGLEGEQWGTPWAVRQSLLLGLSHKQMANWLSVSNSSQNEKHLPLPFSFRAGSCVNCLALFTGSLGLGLWFFSDSCPHTIADTKKKEKSVQHCNSWTLLGFLTTQVFWLCWDSSVIHSCFFPLLACPRIPSTHSLTTASGHNRPRRGPTPHSSETLQEVVSWEVQD